MKHKWKTAKTCGPELLQRGKKVGGRKIMQTQAPTTLWGRRCADNSTTMRPKVAVAIERQAGDKWEKWEII